MSDQPPVPDPVQPEAAPNPVPLPIPPPSTPVSPSQAGGVTQEFPARAKAGPITAIPVRTPNPGKAPQPTAPFNPKAIIAQTQANRAALQAEAKAKEEAAQKVDFEKYSSHVGGIFNPKDPKTQMHEIKVTVFQVRANVGPGGPRPAFVVERTKPHSSWWVPADVFLNTHNRVA